MEQSNKSPFINAAGQNLLPDTVKEALKGLPYASQDGKYFDAMVVARYFGGNYTAYVLENANSDGEVDAAFTVWLRSNLTSSNTATSGSRN